MTDRMRDSQARILITGASGFIGSELCRQLQVAGHPLTLLQHSGKLPHYLLEDPDITVLRGGLTEAELPQQACEEVQLIFHLAGIAHTEGVNPEQMFKSHVDGTRVLLQQAVAHGVKRLVYISSSLASEAQQDVNGASPYAKAKWQAEQLLLKAHQADEIEVVILRPVNVYGVGMKGNIRQLIRGIAKGTAPPLPRLATQLSLVGVSDLCRAAIMAGRVANSAGHTYTVTDGERYGINDIEAAIYRAAGRKKPGWHTPRVLVYAAARAGLGGLSLKTYKNLTTDNIFSNDALCKDLGFSPTTTFYAELPAIVASLSTAPAPRTPTPQRR